VARDALIHVKRMPPYHYLTQIKALYLSPCS